MENKKYFVKQDYRFNLDSMRTSMLNIRDDMRDVAQARRFGVVKEA